MKEIKVYTTSWCGPCKMAKRLLDEKILITLKSISRKKVGVGKIYLKKQVVEQFRRL